MERAFTVATAALFALLLRRRWLLRSSCTAEQSTKTTGWNLLLHVSGRDGFDPDASYREQSGSSLPLVVVTPDTVVMRRLARGQTHASDAVVEIGCSYGQCSRFLLGGQSYLGLDNSYECVRHCRERLPQSRFAKLDALADTAGLRTMLAAERQTLIVVDIGGLRCLPDVLEMIELVISITAEQLPARRPETCEFSINQLSRRRIAVSSAFATSATDARAHEREGVGDGP